MRGSIRTNSQLNSSHQPPGHTPRMQQLFNISTSFDPAHIPNLSFPMDAVHNGENRLSISPSIFEKQASKHWGTLIKQLQSCEARAQTRQYVGWRRPCAWPKITPKAPPLYSPCTYNNPFPPRLHPHAVAKQQPNCEFTTPPPSGPQ